MAEHDYYRILGVGAQATHADIRRAFRTLALRYHPDQHPDDPHAEERFKLITQAYRVLIDSKRRAHYDRTRTSESPRGHAAGHGRRHGTHRRTETTADEETASTADSNIPHPADGRPRGRAHTPWWEEEGPLRPPPPPPPPRPRRDPADGRDLELDMTIATEIAERGGRQALALSRVERCTLCNGTGAKPDTPVKLCPECDRADPAATCRFCGGRGFLIEAFCPSCRGGGKSRVTKTILITVPPLARDGQQIIVPGEGFPGQRGGRTGDLVVRLLVRGGHEYELRESAVYSEVHVTPALVAMGGMIRVKTLDGWSDLAVPAGTRSGTIFCLEGKGPVIQGAGRGDHFVTVKIISI